MIRLPTLVQPAALAAILRTAAPSTVRVLDATWHLPVPGRPVRNGRAEFCAGPRLPHARFFDIDRLGDPATGLPHMLPTQPVMAAALSDLGISAENATTTQQHIVLYDNSSPPAIRAACRAWWTLRAYGIPASRLSVLDGGLSAWIAAGLPVDAAPMADADIAKVGESDLTGEPPFVPFVPVLDSALVRSIDQVRAGIDAGRMQVVDARPPGRFAGRDPEPRAGLPSGHMPTSLNVPSSAVLDATTGKFKTPEELQAVFAPVLAALVSDESSHRELVASCGSGVTAAVLAFALEHAGLTSNVPVYDGSWTEWAQRARDGDIVGV
ncbi:Rhodanese-like domain-containing protein [Blastocladiella britannica]|nr:Rhodanese-like domain-containing protein [Blastocladiella britannica]